MVIVDFARLICVQQNRPMFGHIARWNCKARKGLELLCCAVLSVLEVDELKYNSDCYTSWLGMLNCYCTVTDHVTRVCLSVCLAASVLTGGALTEIGGITHFRASFVAISLIKSDTKNGNFWKTQQKLKKSKKKNFLAEIEPLQLAF